MPMAAHSDIEIHSWLMRGVFRAIRRRYRLLHPLASTEPDPDADEASHGPPDAPWTFRCATPGPAVEIESSEVVIPGRNVRWRAAAAGRCWRCGGPDPLPSMVALCLKCRESALRAMFEDNYHQWWSEYERDPVAMWKAVEVRGLKRYASQICVPGRSKMLKDALAEHFGQTVSASDHLSAIEELSAQGYYVSFMSRVLDTPWKNGRTPWQSWAESDRGSV